MQNQHILCGVSVEDAVLGSEENHRIWPEHVAVIGGGRWARVLLEVLCGLVSPSVRISAHSPHNAQAMFAWASARGLERRIQACPDYPQVTTVKSVAVIVANAARDHEKAIEWALSRRLPVLVEKPVTLSSAATQRMADLAISQKTYLASAHVFLFARYVTAFSKLLNGADGIQAIRVLWMDPRAESRYGEAKSYDPGLTIYADLLPHVLSILGALSPNSIQLGRRLEALRGGAHLKMDVRLGDIPCEIELVRNGASRQRLIEAVTRNGLTSLDFAKEPGTIISAASARCGDPAWDVEPRPAATMLRTFLRGAAAGIYDERLDIGTGLHASRIIDQLSPAYHTAVSAWLRKKYSSPEEEDDVDLRYALSEIIYVEEPLSSVPAEQRVEYVYRHLKEALISPLRPEYESRPVELIRHILKQGKLVSYL